MFAFLNTKSIDSKNFSQKIAELREENKRLVTEREHLRKILSDREDDIKLIRKQWIKEKKQHPETNEKQNIIDEDIVKRLEALQIKYECLKRDLQSLLDEKVDLIQERDAYKCKVHRLNHSMAALLKSGKYLRIIEKKRPFFLYGFTV